MTRASGNRESVTYRKVKNNRLAAVGWVWAFVASTKSAGGSLHHQRRRDRGDRHAAALRNLFNRMLGSLHHYLMTRQTYDEAKAFPILINQPKPTTA